MEIASVVSAATGVVNVTLVLVGLLIALVQWRKARKVTQSEHLRSIIAAFNQNEIARPFYRFINRDDDERADLEHFYLGDLQFVEARQTVGGDVESSDQIEIDIDRMLMLFSEICYERELGVITEEEFRFFDYQIRMTLEHEEVKRYLFDFAEYCGKYHVGYPFLSLVKEGVKTDREMYGAMQRLVTTRSMRIFEYIDSLGSNHRGQEIDESVGEIELTSEYGNVNSTDAEVAIRMHNIKQKHQKH